MADSEKKLEPTGWGGTLVHIHTVADRKVKVLKADGTEGEAMLSQVQAKLLVDANVPFEFALGESILSIHDDAINARRRLGLPDLCANCETELSMTPVALHIRLLKERPWLCRSCSCKRAALGRLGDEHAKKTELAKHALCFDCGAMLPMSAQTVSRRRREPGPHRCRSCAARKHQGGKTPEQRSASAKKAVAKISTQERRERGAKGAAALTDEQRKARNERLFAGAAKYLAVKREKK